MTITANGSILATQLGPEYRQDGRSFAVKDIKDRLIQDADSSTLLLWPPNLFAFTSYILNLSGAYQLVVSPPPGKKKDQLYHWPPTSGLFHQLLRYLREIPPDPFRYSQGVIDTLLTILDAEIAFTAKALTYLRPPLRPPHTKDTYNVWTYLVRKAALEWRFSFEQMTKPSWATFRRRLPVMREREKPLTDEIQTAIQSLPPLLHACWIVFAHAYSLHRSEPTALTVNNLLCNNNADGLGTQQRRAAWLGAVSLLTMHAIADDACVGWGILETAGLQVDFPSLGTIAALRIAHHQARVSGAAVEYPAFMPARVKNSPAQRAAARDLRNRHTMATIAESRARILPKRHNPDVGITLRSLSSNLAFHRSPIEISWDRDRKSALAERLSKRVPIESAERSPKKKSVARYRQKIANSFTMLLLPFPMQIHTSDFQEVHEGADSDALDNREGYGFFRYVQKNTSPRVDEIMQVIQHARLEENTVDMIVLPESALDNSAFDLLKRALTADGRAKSNDRGTKGKPVSVFIAGVSELAKKGVSRFRRNNTVRYGFWDDRGYKTGFQHKHHRWQLNKSQIEQYGLSRSLAIDTKWWEAINVERRKVSFLDIGDRITVCPLICEDLARQDPIADLIRHVGPSLVVTILMDGPQHKDRWSSRYAAILSEDPGSAVLALTSFGMVRRWNSPFGRMSRVVALWNDKVGAREIELEAGASGVLLTLRVENEYEVIADGRRELCATAKILLSDVIQIHIPSGVSGRHMASKRPRKAIKRRT